MRRARDSMRPQRHCALIGRAIGVFCSNGDAGHRFGLKFRETIAGYENEGVAK
jgi:hypothetical protein